MVGGEGCEGLGIETTGGVVDEYDVAKGGDGGGGEGLRIEVWGEGFEKGDIGAGRLAG